MTTKNPQIYIRLGSHAEKEYLLKTAHMFGGLMFGANLVEATPSATASLVIKLCGSKRQLPYLIDPMTYAFGCYVDPMTHEPRSDLDWIKSDQKRGGRVVRDYKRSYINLGEQFSGTIQTALRRGSALTPRDFSTDSDVEQFSKTIAEYQQRRIRAELEKDPEYKELAQRVPQPAAIIAPYFYIEPSDDQAWTNLSFRLMATTAQLSPGLPVHGLLCADESYLDNPAFIQRLIKSIPKTGVNAVWLWFSKFREDSASITKLKAIRQLIEGLSQNIDVYNLHGGFLSLALSRVGLSGLSHGVGYGEQKDVVPVIGQSTPTVRYYLPGIRKRLSVPQIERCFDALHITTAEHFHEQICACVVCKGVLAEGLAAFSEFGEMHRSTPASRRSAQTPAAAKRCRFHYLLDRADECSAVSKLALAAIRGQLEEAQHKWREQPTITSDCEHLERWINVLA